MGNVKRKERIACEGFDFSAQMAPDSSGAMQEIIEVYFDDTARIPGDLLLAANYRDGSLQNISVTYSYTLNGKKHSEAAADSLLQLEYISSLGGISFRQPFPRGALNRRLIFRQTTDNVDGQIAEGYIAAGSQFHHSDFSNEILYAVNSRKAFRFGSVQFVTFRFQVQADQW